ncbi:MAG: hypothetical protein ABR537_00285 [Gemmatimonadales bacterium]
MKAYLSTTATLFGLLALAHVWRIIGEWPRVMHDSGELIEAAIGVIAALLSLWACRLLREQLRRRRESGHAPAA